MAGVLDRLPGVHKHQPLLRVHEFGFARRDGEEQRIEFEHPVDEAAPMDIGLAWIRSRVAVDLPPVPAVGRDAGNAIAARNQVGPERVHVLRHRETATLADDDDGIVVIEPGPPIGVKTCFGNPRRNNRHSRSIFRLDGEAQLFLRQVDGDVACEPFQGRVFEEIGGRQRQAELSVDPRGKGGHRHRVEAEIAEFRIDVEFRRIHFQRARGNADDKSKRRGLSGLSTEDGSASLLGPARRNRPAGLFKGTDREILQPDHDCSVLLADIDGRALVSGTNDRPHALAGPTVNGNPAHGIRQCCSVFLARFQPDQGLQGAIEDGRVQNRFPVGFDRKLQPGNGYTLPLPQAGDGALCRTVAQS